MDESPHPAIDHEVLWQRVAAILHDSPAHLRINPLRIKQLQGRQGALIVGGYGDVYKAKLRGANFLVGPEVMAVKRLRPNGDREQRIRVFGALARDLVVWSRMKHPNILGLEGFAYDENDLSLACIVTRWQENGNVFYYVSKTEPDLYRRLELAIDTAQGLSWLHTLSTPVCHGDIKAENTLVDDLGNAMLSDFGLAKVVTDVPSGLTTNKNANYTLRYASPELLDAGDISHTLPKTVSDDDSDDGAPTPGENKISTIAKDMASPLREPSSSSRYFRGQPASSSGGEPSTPTARRDARMAPQSTHQTSLAAARAPSAPHSPANNGRTSDAQEAPFVVSSRAPKERAQPMSNPDPSHHDPLQVSLQHPAGPIYTNRDYFSSEGTPSIELQTLDEDTGRAKLRLEQAVTMPVGRGRPSLPNHPFHSMLNLGSLEMKRDEPESVALSPRVVVGRLKEDILGGGQAQSLTRSPKRQQSPLITRRRSLPDMSGRRAMPPPYPKFSAREDEGREVLPLYSCRIHFEAYLTRKMEFKAPGVASPDRSWKRVYAILNGTSLWIFKHNPRSHPVKTLMSSSRFGPVARALYPPGGKKGDGVVHLEDVVVGAPHVHLPEGILPTVDAPLNKSPSRESTEGPSSSASRLLSSHTSPRSLEVPPRHSMGASLSPMAPSTAARSPGAGGTEGNIEKTPSRVSSSSSASAFLGAIRRSNSQSISPGAASSWLASFQSNVVLRRYSLVNAETGLASEYVKRKNVIRVKTEGEQFLIQADNILMAIDWIETFQAGANVTLDLDERPMVKAPVLPRRRRQRRETVAAENDTASNPIPPPFALESHAAQKNAMPSFFKRIRG